jgi:pilus assembly protein CpaB
MSNRRRVLGIAAAVALGVIGVFALISYVQGAEDRALAGERVVNVYVASQDIPAGTPGDMLDGKVKLERIPAKVRADGAVATLDRVKGLETSIALLPGEQLTVSRFARPGASALQRSSSGTKIPNGWFQATLQLEPAQALGGTLKVGQRVAIVAAVNTGVLRDGVPSGVVVRNAIVTNVQIDGDKGDAVDRKEVTNAPTGDFLVTLALPQAELERVVSATNQGEVWLATEPGVG